eukprot:15347626-Ditylum_brightwellii.AAC.1
MGPRVEGCIVVISWPIFLKSTAISLSFATGLLVKFATSVVRFVLALARLATVVQSTSIACAKFASSSAVAVLSNADGCIA